jgi:hypothetical protein
MPTVFVAGSIKIKKLHGRVREKLDQIIAQGLHVVVGDAAGADSAVQRYLADCGATSVSVYCSGSKPRNNLGGWPVTSVDADARPGTREYYMANDVAMAEEADYGLMIWDAQSVGTLKNVIELLARGKKAYVFVDDLQALRAVGDASQLDALLAFMTSEAREEAERKIEIPRLGQASDSVQLGMFN